MKPAKRLDEIIAAHERDDADQAAVADQAIALASELLGWARQARRLLDGKLGEEE